MTKCLFYIVSLVVVDWKMNLDTSYFEWVHEDLKKYFDELKSKNIYVLNVIELYID